MNRALGPGASDMKGGLLAGLYAMRALRALDASWPRGQVVLVANPDEEVASPESTPVTVPVTVSAPSTASTP